MLNIIILLLLFHFIGNILFGNSNSTILYCGLYGFVADSSKKFNWDKFNILGSFNDSRGGDSCGRTHGNIAEWGLNRLSNYNDYVEVMPNSPMNSNVIIGHSRKASSGGRDDKFAQPIIFKSDSDVFLEKFKNAPRKYKKWANAMSKQYGTEPFIAFAGVHNGTLSNFKELATNYNIDFTDKNDTTVLMEIIFKYGYNVLEEYIGSAALLIYDAFSPQSLTIFKGYSPHAVNASHSSEERPLYYWQKSKNTVYISSMESPLKFIGGGDIINVPDNKLLQITNGIVTQNRIINRDKVGQRESYTTKAWDNYDNSFSSGSVCMHSNYSAINRHIPVTGYKKSEETFNINEKYPDNFRVFGEITKVHFNKEKQPDTYMDHLFYWKGRYWLYQTLKEIRDPKFANGVYYVDFAGTIFDSSLGRGTAYYFIEGILMRGASSYAKAKILMNKDNIISTHSKFAKRALTKKLAPFIALPIHTFDNEDFSIQDVTGPSFKNKPVANYFSGTITPPFSKRVYYIKKGDVIGVELNTVHNSPLLNILREESIEKSNSQIKITKPIKEFFLNNYAFCSNCVSAPCNDCIVLQDFEGKGTKIPNLGENHKLDLTGKTIKAIVIANKIYYFGNYDFCQECENADCDNCVVVHQDGTVIPTYKDETTKAYTALRKEIQTDENIDDLPLVGSVLEQHIDYSKKSPLEINNPLANSNDDITGDEIARTNLGYIINNINNSMQEIEEEIVILDKDKITNDVSNIIIDFKKKLLDLNLDLL